MKAIALCYHDVRDDASVGLSARYTLIGRDFRCHLQCLQDRGIGVHIKAIDRITNWRYERPVFLTFDDGARSAYTIVAEELETNNWLGYFFIVSDWINRPGFLSSREIRDLRRRGHVIGSHTKSHPARMSHLSWDDLVDEWSVSCIILSDILGEPVLTGSVANGYYSRKVGSAAAAAGLQILFTSEPTVTTAVVDGCLILGRYSILRQSRPSLSAEIAMGHSWSGFTQTCAWRVKKCIKALSGERYLGIRSYLLSLHR